MGMDNYTVYKHISPSNKVYIGITCQSIANRWRYGYGYLKCPYFYKAIQKYGWENIKHEILYKNLSKEEAIKKEIELIKKYNSNNIEKGYNLTQGGEGNLGAVFTEERKRNISKAKMGHKVSEETKQKIRESTTGSKHWNFGKTISEKTREKISTSRKGIKFTPEHISKLHTFKKGAVPWNKNIPMTEETKIKLINSSKKNEVLCVETNIKYKSIREAYRETNINFRHIGEVCKGIRKTAGGYHWQYARGC